MTLEDFRKLKTGDYVRVSEEIYSVEVVFLPGFDEYIFVSNKNIIKLKLSAYCDEMYVVSDGHSFGKVSISSTVVYRHMERIASEKEVLEIQLKEEQEILNASTEKIISIKQKISELDSPKIGKMYRLTCKSNNHSWYGALVGITIYKTYQFVSYDDTRKVVTEGFPIEGFSKCWSFVEVPEKEHIAKSILEFIKLGEQK